MSVSEVIIPLPMFVIQVGRRDEDESRSIEKLLKELIVNYLKIILANRFPLIWEVIWLALGSWLVSVAVIESSRSDRSVIEESRQM